MIVADAGVVVTGHVLASSRVIQQQSALWTSAHGRTELTAVDHLLLALGQDSQPLVSAVARRVAAELLSVSGGLPLSETMPAELELPALASGAVRAVDAHVRLVLPAAPVVAAGTHLDSFLLLKVVFDDLLLETVHLVGRETGDVSYEEIFPARVASTLAGVIDVRTVEGELSLEQLTPAEFRHRLGS